MNRRRAALLGAALLLAGIWLAWPLRSKEAVSRLGFSASPSSGVFGGLQTEDLPLSLAPGDATGSSVDAAVPGMGRWDADVVGRVMDEESGLPVPGIRVEAAALGTEDGPSGDAVTDAQGEFRVRLSRMGIFPEALPWELRVNPEPDIESPYQDELRLDGFPPLYCGETRRCETVLAQGVEVAVRVERADGKEANGLLRACRGPRERSLMILEGRAEPFFVARTGPYGLAASRVRAQVNPHAPSAWAPLGVFPSDGRKVDVLIRVGEGMRLSGRVVWADGQSCSDARVEVWPVEGDRDAHACSARCDGQGSFEVSGLDAGGRYWVQAGSPGLKSDLGRMDGPVQATPGEHVELRLLPTENVPFILTVRHLDGRPIQKGVQLRHRDGSGGFVYRWLDADAEGRCRVTCLAPGMAAEVLPLWDVDASSRDVWIPVPAAEGDPGLPRDMILTD